MLEPGAVVVAVLVAPNMGLDLEPRPANWNEGPRVDGWAAGMG